MCDTCYTPIQCIIAPEMVENIKLRGTSKQRKWAVELEEVAKEYRGRRKTTASPRSAVGPISRSAGPAQGRKLRDISVDGRSRKGRKEGDGPTGDEDVDTAYEFAGVIYDFLQKEFQRNSIDGSGSPLKATVHFKKRYNNAFWDGDELKYGDGDNRVFTSFARDLTISAHEHAHGIIHFSGGLKYQDQAGALNESIADVFAAMVQQYHLKQEVHEASWLIGEAIFKPSRRKIKNALRSLKAPGTAYNHTLLGTDSQPYHMDHYVHTSADHGGIHLNSGIPNHAFYLLSMQLGGHSWEKAGKIWYQALLKADNPLITFKDWASLTVEESRKQFGNNSPESLIVKRSWKLVGINVF